MKKSQNAKTVAKITSSEVILSNYGKLLSDIQKQIKQTGDLIIKTVTREKVVMAWNIGKMIDGHLLKNNKSGYGEKLFDQLAKDILISKAVLYKMRSFYHSYPKLPKDDDQLNWTHYQTLSGIKKADERKYLEDLTKENNWNADNLQKEVTKLKTKNGKGKFAKEFSEKSVAKKLRSERGQLYSYPILKFAETEKTYLDLGFNIFKEIEETLPQAVSQADAVDVSKKNEKYSLSKSTIHPRKFNTYKAYLERVVDGDTIRVTIDLGFKILHKEIIRLKGIDAAEIATNEGKKSSAALNKILKNISFLIIKTIKIDIYGRYVADIFFSENNQESDPQKIADGGIYLNQLLLDEGLVKKLTISS